MKSGLKGMQEETAEDVLNSLRQPARRLGWVRGAALLAVALYLILTIAVWIALALEPTSGAYFDRTPRGAAISQVMPHSPADRAGFRPGDVARSVDGVPTPNYQALLFVVRQHRPGDTVVYELQRVDAGPEAGSLYRAQITLQSTLFTGASFELLTRTGVGLLTLTVAAGVAIFRPELVAARLLLLASAAVGFAAISLAWQSVTTDAGSSGYMWLLRGYVFVLVLGPAALVHLFLVFPRRSPLLVRLDSLGPPKLRIGTFVPLLMFYCLPITIALVLLESAEPLGVLRGGVPLFAQIPLPLPLPGQRNWVAPIVFLVAAMLLGAVFALSQIYLRPTSAGVRVQMRWVLGALVVLFVSELWGRGVYVVQGYLAHRPVGLPPPPLPEAFAWLALPVAVGVAVVRHQLFDIRLLVRATVLYAPLTILLVGAYLGLVFALSRTIVAILGPDSASDPTVSVLAALGVAGLAYPLRQRLQGLLERTLYRDQLAGRRFVEAANYVLGRAQPPDVVAEFLTTRTVELLGLSGAWFVTPARPNVAGGRAVLHYPPAGLPEGLSDVAGAVLLARAEGRHDGPDSPDADVLPVDGPVLESWYAMGARLVVPLRVAEPTSAEVLGFWLLGARRSGTAFDREDRRGCTRVGHQAAVLLENAQFQEEQVQQTVMRRELDRARDLQQRLLPRTVQGWPGLLEIAARFRPARETSGDFYDLLPLVQPGVDPTGDELIKHGAACLDRSI
jgi:hypothetical protein